MNIPHRPACTPAGRPATVRASHGHESRRTDADDGNARVGMTPASQPSPHQGPGASVMVATMKTMKIRFAPDPKPAPQTGMSGPRATGAERRIFPRKELTARCEG